MRAEQVCKRSNVGLKTDVSACVQEDKSNDEEGMLGKLISFSDVLLCSEYPLAVKEHTASTMASNAFF